MNGYQIQGKSLPYPPQIFDSLEYEPALRVEQLVERAARHRAGAVAVQFGEARLTYGELWERSGRVAVELVRLAGERGLGPNPLIGVLVERSEAMLPVLLGIWRAGGAFVPLDPDYPKDRLQYIVEHSGIRLILATGSLLGMIEAPGAEYRDIAAIQQGHGSPAAPEPSTRSSEDLAYVIYTSGSTGKPKGVQVPHRALNNFLRSMQRSPGLRPEDRVLAITTLSFDIAELELWLPLVSGARAVIVDRATAIDGQALIRVLAERKITFVQATPATWRLLLASDWEGNPAITALCGGEALPRELAEQILARVGALWNVYGPTETTVWSTMDRVGPGAITIGRPIGNTQTYILDAGGNWVPRGVVGELWLGGDGVTKGYLGREDLTRERFVPDRFTGNGHLYRTGDLVRLRTDGRIEYVGRNDFQVKVRGYRIELGEIQTALARHPAVRECVVCVKRKAGGDACLVAFYCLKAGRIAPSSELREALRKTLPDYMVPTHLTELGKLPLTPNGKVDVKSLIEGGSVPEEAPPAPDYQAPETELEAYLAQLWTEVLSCPRVGRGARFLEMGGTSLLAVRVINRVRKERGLRLPPKLLLVHTLEQIALDLGGFGNAREKSLAASQGTESPLGQASIQAIGNACGTAAIPGFITLGAQAEGRQVFRCFHPGERRASQAVLLCPPLGQEYMRSHWLIRNVASALSRRGLPVLRFDYFGHGDSSGGPEDLRLRDLEESLLAAAGELRHLAGSESLQIMAFRASSLIADRVAGRLGGVRTLAVEPVSSGREHLAMLRETQRNRWKAYPYPKKPLKTEAHEELLGALYSAEWLRELETLAVSRPEATSVIRDPRAPGWEDFRRIEEHWLSPAVVAEIEDWSAGRTC